jgi:FAD/FMN-containing dehydrogenase
MARVSSTARTRRARSAGAAPRSTKAPPPARPEIELEGWGNYPRARCKVTRPEEIDAVVSRLDPEGTLARGLGRAYGDAALNRGHTVIDCTRLNRILDFDDNLGVVTCEAGVSLGDLIATFTPRGWFPMITPGTKIVTVGGCIANDVHGKAHHKDGCFNTCVESFTILLADGSVRRASRNENSDLSLPATAPVERKERDDDSLPARLPRRQRA